MTKKPLKHGGTILKPKLNYTQIHDQLCWDIIIAVCNAKLARLWMNPTGAAYRNGRLIRYGLKGSADITGIMPWGQRVEIEVKTGKATQKENQESFEKMILKNNGIYFVGRSVESVLNSLKILTEDYNARINLLHGERGI